MRSVGSAGMLRKIGDVGRVEHDCTRDGLPKFSVKDDILWRQEQVPKGQRSCRWSITGKWRVVLLKYRDALDASASSYLDAACERGVVCCETGLIKYLTEVSRISIAATVHIGHGPWTYLCDVHVLGGYDSVLNRVDVMSNIAEQVGRPGSDSLFQHRGYLRNEMKKALRFIGVKTANRASFQAFLDFRDNWTGPGACNLGKAAILAISSRGKTKNVKVRSKLGNLAGTTTQELFEWCTEKKGAQIKPFRKEDEPIKTRAVFGYDVRSFLRCAYVDHFFGDYNKNGTWTPLGCSTLQRGEQRIDIWSRLGLATGARAVSLDQSSFDLNQPKWIVRDAIELIFDRAIHCMPKVQADELKLLKEMELFAYDNAYVEGVCSWEKGVPSGHRWTALIDTVINRAECMLAAKIRGVRIDYGLWQGDDGLVFEQGIPRMSWAQAYQQLDLKVNENKTWVEDNACEFLHEFYTPKGVRAFPARAFRSVIWRKPLTGSSGFKGAEDYARERLDTFLKCSRRGLSGMAARTINLLSRKGLSKLQSLDVMRTSKAIGGLGWDNSGRATFEVVGGEVDVRRVSVVSNLANRHVGEWVEHGFLKRAGAMLPLPVKVSRWRFKKLKLPSNTVKLKGFKTAPLRLTWGCEDGDQQFGSPWMCQLGLEFAEAGRMRWRDDLVPSKVLRSSVLGCEKAYRLVSRYSGAKMSLENDRTIGESYAVLADWANRMWQGFLAYVVLSGQKNKTGGLSDDWLGFARDVFRTQLGWQLLTTIRV